MTYPDLLTEPEVLETITSRMKLLAEPMRFRLLSILREKECCVKELVDETGAGQANISKHLSILRTGGVISSRKEGLFVYYSVSDSSVFHIYDSVTESLSFR